MNCRIFRKSIYCLALLLLSLGAVFSQNSLAGEDITLKIRQMQASAPLPAEDFRPGHVVFRGLEDYLQKSETGYSIQLPHQGLTPSPTFRNGIIYLSGGFGSKEFYAFKAENGELLWALNLDDDGPSSAVVEEGIVVFNTESCTIFACEAETGVLLWSYFLGDPLLSTPSIKDGIVYTAFPAGRNLSLGNYGIQNQQLPVQQNTSIDFSQSSDSSMQKEDKSSSGLYPSHVLIALELKTGKILWQQWINGDIMSSPVVEKNELYVVTFPGTLFKFNPQSGALISAYSSRATSAPVIVEDQLFLTQRADSADANDLLECISTINQTSQHTQSYYEVAAPYLDQRVQNNTQLKALAVSQDAGNGFSAGAPESSGWQAAQANIGQSNVSSLQAYQGSRILYFRGNTYNTMGAELICTQPETGNILWKHKLEGDMNKSGGHLATAPLVVDTYILIATVGGDVILFDANSGKEYKRYAIKEEIRYQPIVWEGRIYVTTLNGKMYCIDTKNPTLSGWPTWGANSAHTNKTGY